MKRFLLAILFLVSISTACFVCWLLYALHPFAPPGSVFLSGKWHFNDCEFQVWQRKNISAWEFDDGLFVRRGTNAWQIYVVGRHDCYALRVKLKQSKSVVEVYSGGKYRGDFDMAAGTFRLQPDDRLLKPEVLVGATNPPGPLWATRH